jgi:hypothetical protein
MKPKAEKVFFSMKERNNKQAIIVRMINLIPVKYLFSESQWNNRPVKNNLHCFVLRLC